TAGRGRREPGARTTSTGGKPESLPFQRPPEGKTRPVLSRPGEIVPIAARKPRTNPGQFLTSASRASVRGNPPTVFNRALPRCRWGTNASGRPKSKELDGFGRFGVAQARKKRSRSPSTRRTATGRVAW